MNSIVFCVYLTSFRKRVRPAKTSTTSRNIPEEAGNYRKRSVHLRALAKYVYRLLCLAPFEQGTRDKTVENSLFEFRQLGAHRKQIGLTVNGQNPSGKPNSMPRVPFQDCFWLTTHTCRADYYTAIYFVG